MKVKVAIAQVAHPADGDVLSQVECYAKRAASHGVKLLAFPECLMTPSEKTREEYLASAQSLEGAFARAVDELAKRLGMWIAYTVNELNPTGAQPFNTLVLTDGEGTQRAVYRKVHLFESDTHHESERMSAGDEILPPVTAPFGRIGLGICYDLRFPEMFRKLALAGCDIMVLPAAWVDGPGKAHQWKTLLMARAIENQMFVLGADRVGGGRCGCSCMVDPLGAVIAEAGEDECLLVAELDDALLEQARRTIPVLEHRRPQLY